jgi:hypothetical protein
VLAAVATMGLAAGDSKLGEACINRLDRLAIQLAETVDAIARANGLSTEELAERIPGKLSLLLHEFHRYHRKDHLGELTRTQGDGLLPTLMDRIGKRSW